MDDYVGDITPMINFKSIAPCERLGKWVQYYFRMMVTFDPSNNWGTLVNITLP